MEDEEILKRVYILELDYPNFNYGPVSWIALEESLSFSLKLSFQICELNPISFFHHFKARMK